MNNPPSKTILNPSEHWNQLRNTFIDQTVVMMVFLALLALPASLSRASATGWLPVYTIHIILAVITLFLWLFRKRMSFAAKSAFVIAMWSVISATSLLTFGLLASGVAWLVYINFLVAAIYSPRMITATVVLSLTILGIVGFGFVTGVIKLSVDAYEYTTQTSSWVTAWVTLACMLFVTFRSMGALQQSTRDLLQEIREQQEQIVRLANHDPLTDLPLMRLARDRFEVASRHAERTNTKVAVLFIDLDNFKAINDTYGHASGDYVLQQTAQRISKIIRAEDTVARISGDEFLAILGDVTEPQAVATVAQKIISALSHPMIQGNNSLSVGTSVGIALFPDNASDIDTLKRLADKAMYKVKKTGKNNFTFISATKSQAIVSDE